MTKFIHPETSLAVAEQFLYIQEKHPKLTYTQLLKWAHSLVYTNALLETIAVKAVLGLTRKERL